MNIRTADKFDLLELVEMMRHYSAHSPVVALRTDHNEEHVRNLLYTIMVGAGVIWVAERDNEIVGMLACIRQQNIWNPKVMLLSELAFWVEEEFRGGSAAYRLLKAYEQYAEEQKRDGHIVAYTISKLHTSIFKPEKLGYTAIEQTYIKQ
jgi:N-acetylglutamate synthase-like GNAT family acetyltransferase